MNTAPAQSDDSADALSQGPIDGVDSPPIPAVGDSAPRKLRKRERTWIILLLLIGGVLLIELFDRFIGIPNR